MPVSTMFEDVFIESLSDDAELDGISLTIIGLTSEDEQTRMLERESDTTWCWPGFITLKPTIANLIFSVRSKNGTELGTVNLCHDELSRFLEVDDDIEYEREFLPRHSVRSLKMTFAINLFNIDERTSTYIAYDIQKIVRDVVNRRSSFEDVVDLLATSEAGPAYLHLLGIYFTDIFEDKGGEEVISYAIRAYELALKDTSSDDSSYAVYSHAAGTGYLSRFMLSGQPADLDQALSLLQLAVTRSIEHDVGLPERLNRLGIAYRTRFEINSDLADLESAILSQQRAVQLTPVGHADLAARLASLSNSFRTRFERRRDLGDINKAIANTELAISITSEWNRHMPMWLNNLGGFHQIRFRATGDANDADLGTRYQETAIHSSSKNHPKMPIWLNNLGCSYQTRFERTTDLDDIGKAIANQQQAIELTSDDHPQKPLFFRNLGRSYHSKFLQTRDPIDIDNSILNHQLGLGLTPEGHAGMPARLRSLALALVGRFKHTRKQGDLLRSISSFRSAATHVTGRPSIRLDSARDWARLCRENDRPQSLRAFKVVIELIAQVAGLEDTVHKRHANLVDVSNLTTLAAAAALDENEHSLAVEWLEQGRCLTWNQISQLRRPVDSLKDHDPVLAEKFSKVARALEESGSRSEDSELSLIEEDGDGMEQMIAIQDKVYTHVHLAKEYNTLLCQIRELPGFNAFLRPLSTSDMLAKLPTTGSVVTFVVHEDRCDALALKPGLDAPIHVPLNKLSFRRAVELRDALHMSLRLHRVRGSEPEADDFESDRGVRLSKWVARDLIKLSSILEEIWLKVVEPVLHALGYLSSVPSSERPRICWCPSGPLAFLPLHAAGLYTRSPICAVSDFIISSYTPNLTTLLNKLGEANGESHPTAPTSLLLISQPGTPGLNPIPGTTVETREIHKMLDGLPDRFNSLLLENDAATIDRVKEEMKTHSWVHFACHAVQDPMDALKSGPHLHDGRLELLEIMRQRGDPHTTLKTELAFLSACQTGTGDEKLSDEVVHIAAGMLAVGYRCVVATMWSIKDAYGRDVALGFYRYLLEQATVETEDRMANAALALDRAVRDIRSKLQEEVDAGRMDMEDALLIWVPYVHYGV